MFKVEAVVVGAGVVGLAIARALALRGVQVLLLEKEGVIGSGTSSRNSEVIHAGLYYEPGSLKARLCVRGSDMLYRYCDERHVPHRRCGKLVVATDQSEEAYLDHLSQRAAGNGVEDVELIGSEQLSSLEPQIRGTSALLSPCSGIVDSACTHECYQADAEAAGTTIVLRTPVLAAIMPVAPSSSGPAESNPRTLRPTSLSTPPGSTPGTSPPLSAVFMRRSRQNFSPKGTTSASPARG